MTIITIGIVLGCRLMYLHNFDIPALTAVLLFLSTAKLEQPRRIGDGSIYITMRLDGSMKVQICTDMYSTIRAGSKRLANVTKSSTSSKPTSPFVNALRTARPNSPVSWQPP
eukprot:scaffold21268_cov23-Cyclotella_meneghiniana.AAC.1